MPKPYDQGFKDRALRMLAEALPERGSVHAASKHVGGLLGVSPDTLRVWHRHTQVDAGERPGVTTDIAAEIQRLHKKNYSVYGVCKMHAKLQCEGWVIGRDQTARLMKLAWGAWRISLEEGVHHEERPEGCAAW